MLSSRNLSQIAPHIYRNRKRPRLPHLTAFSWRERSSDSANEANSAQWLKDINVDEAIDSRRLYRYLGLETFTQSEFHEVFQAIQKHTAVDQKDKAEYATLNQTALQSYLEQRIQELEDSNDHINRHDDDETASLRRRYVVVETQRCMKFFEEHGIKDGLLTQENLAVILKDTATSIDMKRVWPITLSMLLVGSSVGVTTPAMPFVVQNLGLTTGEYGLVVSAFALAKMTGNIPSAVLVERHGRKPYLVYSMAVIAMGVGGIGLASSFEQLYLCRLFTGLGVAGLSTAATLTVTDLSTPLNRASTFAPIMSAFAAGTALGPALGGILCDSIGINPTFYMVGVSYIGLAAVNKTLLSETKPKPIKFPWQMESNLSNEQASIRESFETAVGQWIPLLSQSSIRNVCTMNAFYWMALAGSQMTLLPLILTDPDGLAMTATNVGQVYMGMSVVQVLGNPILAKVVDRVGKVPGIVGGCTIIATAMGSLPLCTDIYQMAGVLGVWAAGSSLLSTAPLAFISDKVDDEKRAQAIALLRTSGDVGFLIGASSMGALADWAGSLDMAMQTSSGILLTATGWFAARNLMTLQLEKQKKRS